MGALSRYELRGELGRGGAGVVYEAYDPRTGSFVALKTIEASAPENLYRLKREFRALADVQHPEVEGLGSQLPCELRGPRPHRRRGARAHPRGQRARGRCFERAVTAARTYRSAKREALALELGAAHARAAGDLATAGERESKAIVLYRRWGASAKADALERTATTRPR